VRVLEGGEVLQSIHLDRSSFACTLGGADTTAPFGGRGWYGCAVDEGSLTDLHVHTEWSYDAADGWMEGSCRRAVELGVPTIAFTEHADFEPPAPALDVEGYVECVERCRSRFRDVRILSGVELGAAHRFRAEADALLKSYAFDLILGSCHSIPVGDRLVDIGEEGTLEPRVAHESVRAFFGETLQLVEEAPVFAVLTHLDYPKRYWPHDRVPYSELDFEAEYRAILKAAASSGVALEINSDAGNLGHGPCPGDVVVRWWREAGGSAVSFASDAHEPAGIRAGFEAVAGIAEAAGFRPAAHDLGLWLR
jgi:histidinol-phosphatase (PHP family)